MTAERDDRARERSAEPAPRGAPDRRSLLRGAAVGGFGLLATAPLAGCGGGSGDQAAATPSAAAPPATGGASPTAGAGAGGGTPLVEASKVPVGGGVVIKPEKVVVTQPVAATFKAFSTVCTHKGCDVSTVTGGTINCPCHGSKYNLADGSPTAGPAPRPLPAVQITHAGGWILRA